MYAFDFYVIYTVIFAIFSVAVKSREVSNNYFEDINKKRRNINKDYRIVVDKTSR